MLVDRRHLLRITLLSGASAVLAAASASLTLANPDMYAGVMAPDMIIGALGFDLMSLLVALAMAACLTALWRGHDAAWLVWSGLQGYLLYAYALYAFDFVSTPMYLAYVAILGLSAYAFAVFVRSLNMRFMRHWHRGALPRNAMAGTLFTIAGMFAAAWTYMLLAATLRRVELPSSTIIVMDLAFTLPLLVIVAGMLARHRPLGDFLAPGVFALSAAITLGVSFGELLRPLFGQRFEAGVAAPYLLPGVVCLAFAVFAFVRVARTIPHAPPHQEKSQ
jgi:hypothetical protein